MRKTRKNCCRHGVYILVGGTVSNQDRSVNHKVYYIVIPSRKKNKAENEGGNCEDVGDGISNRVV